MKSKIDMLKPLEALQHQPTTGQQRHCDSNLGNDQDIQPATAGRGCTSLVTLFETRHDFAFARAFPCRHQSENHTRCERYEERKTQNTSVDLKIMKESSEGNSLNGIHRRENRRHPIGK